MPSTSATQSLLDELKSRLALWSPPLPWAVAYSGGRDSGVLLWALTQCTSSANVVALHVDHGWRSKQERASEVDLVSAWCGRLGVGIRLFEPPETVRPTEAAARAHRFSCFESFTHEHPDSPVFLAHHADDQAETVLMRLLRGRSWQGLGGMAAVRGPYHRPLLRLRASLLAAVATEQGIPFHEDSTNTDPQHARNLIRREVFPLLTSKFPRAVEALGDFARTWSGVSRGKADPAWKLFPEGGELAVEVWDAWGALEREMQLLAVATKGGEASLTRRFLEEVVAPHRSAAAQGGGWRWSRTSESVRWEKVQGAEETHYFVTAEPGFEYKLGAYSFTWAAEESDGWLAVPGLDPGKPLVWRSAVKGMTFASWDDPDWGKARRRSRLGELGPDSCVLLIQGGLIRAALDPLANRVLWSETGAEKLHKGWIFVKLRQRSDYERR